MVRITMEAQQRTKGSVGGQRPSTSGGLRLTRFLSAGALLAVLSGCTAQPDNPYIDTSPTVVPSEPVVMVESAPIPAGLSAEEFADVLYEDRYTAWMMAGATKENDDGLLDYAIANGQGHTGEYSTQIAQAESVNYIRDLYVEDASPTDIDFFIARNAANLERFFITHESDDERDLEPYNAWYTVDSAVEKETTSTGRTLEISYTANTNQNKNRVGSDYDTEGRFDGSVVTVIITTQIVDGFEKITAEELVP